MSNIVEAAYSITENYENAVISLLRNKAFFAKLIMSMKKDLNFPIPTAAVGISSTGITLHLNPVFFNSLTMDERVAILEHECLHILHGHALRFKNFQSKDAGLANVACDVAINQFIPNIPKFISMPGPDGKMVEGSPVTYEIIKTTIPDLLPNMNAEYYFNKIKQDQKENPDKYQTVDDHSKWEETDMTPEQQEKFVKQHVKAILGTCSDQEKQIVDQKILDELYKSDINWKAQLRAFFANSEETFTETTRKKRNRRYGIIQPGNKNEPKLRLAINIDTSGSVSDKWLQMIFGEVERIYNEHTMVLYIIEADCVVQNIYTYKKGMKFAPKGRGGTAYQPAFDKCKELNVDAAIYAGDMDASDLPKKPKFPVLWAIVGNQKPPANFGKAIYIK